MPDTWAWKGQDMTNVMVVFVSVLSIIASVTCLLVVRINRQLIQETHTLYLAINTLMVEAVWPEKDEPK